MRVEGDGRLVDYHRGGTMVSGEGHGVGERVRDIDRQGLRIDVDGRGGWSYRSGYNVFFL